MKGNLSRHFSAYVSILAGMLAVAVLLLFGASQLSAQDTGYIGGTVTDKSGAAIANASVVLTSTAGSLTRTTATNADGAYVIAGLPGASYNISITATGFQKYTANGVVLDVAQKTRIDVQLSVGSVSEEVVVTGESVAQVETASSEIGTTISGKQVNQLELNGRNFTQLVTLTPGVVSQTNQDEGTVGVNGNVAFSMNGGRTEYNNWELDGGDNMDNGSNSTLNVYPNIEAIAEFKVLTSTYGAQYGRNGSGTIEVETKSGGNTFHGSAFEYLRNDMFNARPWESGGEPGNPNPPYKKHDFGYTVGGPVYIPRLYHPQKQKTFFFWSQEWRREKNPDAVTQNVPSAAERNGDFSDLCPGPDCPKVPNPAAVPISVVGQALESLIPLPNSVNAGFPSFSQTVSLPTTWREELVRVDHNITDNYRLTFRYIHDSWSTINPNPLWGVGTSSFNNINTNFVGPGTSFVARLTANVTPTLLNEFVASYTADHIDLSILNAPALPAGFAMGSLFNNGFGGKLPGIQLQSNIAYGGSFGQDTGYFPWTNSNPTYTYRDNVTKIVRNHTLQFGAYFAAAQKNEDNSVDTQGILTFDTSSPISSGNSFADLLMGNIASYKQSNSTIKYYNRYKIVEPYFQDDWRVTKKFTLNLGVRVSLFGTYRERYQNAFNFEPTAFVAGASPAIDNAGTITGSSGALVPGSGNPFNGIIQCGGKGGTSAAAGFPSASVGPSADAGCLKGHLFNPAPRVGFAWDPKGDGKLAIRGGYGVFFEHTNGNEGNTESLENSPPLALTSTQANVVGYGTIGGGGLLFPLSVNSIPNKAIWPYMQQWNLNVQKELPSHVLLSVAYVGSKGTHLVLLSDANQLVPVSSANNPYASGTPIVAADCANFTTNANGLPTSATLGNGAPVPAAALSNLWIACGNNADPLRTAFPGFSQITQLANQANSIYNALQVSAQRTVGDLTLSASYSYSHSIDDSSDRSDTAFVNSYDPAANRASSTFDQRHSLSVSYVYGLPFFKRPGLSHTLLGGWQVSGITVAQTGLPFTVTNGTTFGDNAGVGNGVGTGSRPDLVGDPRASIPQTEFPDVRGPVIFNPAAFALPTGLTFGNVGRNTLNYPGRLNFDFGTFKRFAINERAGFEFKWECFNLFNHTQFDQIDNQGLGTNGIAMDTANPGANLDSSNFLHLTGAHAPRRMQFGLRFYF
ncbi:MAG TPA: carboxypeptidase regulatory-like domain-containing protein [Candidatus Sulfotelmatobacter sp.]|nr:carboxypeptidase regulatory-like domain-containing protein [Candidatus Sulfotelmatobacter sp.]